MVRRKKRYILVYSKNILSKDRCKAMSVYLVEQEGCYAIVRCYLSDLKHVISNLNDNGIITLNTSGTLKALRERKDRVIAEFENRLNT